MIQRKFKFVYFAVDVWQVSNLKIVNGEVADRQRDAFVTFTESNRLIDLYELS
jgi:hypothetical protein